MWGHSIFLEFTADYLSALHPSFSSRITYVYLEQFLEYAVAHLVKALRYKSEGRGLDSRWPSGLTMALRSTQPLTEMSTRNNSWGIKAAGA